MTSGSPLPADSSILFDISLSFFEYLLTFWHNPMFQAQSLPSLLNPWNWPFSKDDWSFLMDNNIQKPKLEHCMCSLLLMCQGFQAFPKDGARKYKYLYTYTYLYISVCINMLQIMSSYQYLQFHSNTTQVLNTWVR